MFATYPMEGKKHELWIFFSRISNSEIHVTQCVPCKVRHRVPMPMPCCQAFQIQISFWVIGPSFSDLFHALEASSILK